MVSYASVLPADRFDRWYSVTCRNYSLFTFRVYIHICVFREK